MSRGSSNKKKNYKKKSKRNSEKNIDVIRNNYTQTGINNVPYNMMPPNNMVVPNTASLPNNYDYSQLASKKKSNGLLKFILIIGVLVGLFFVGKRYIPKYINANEKKEEPPTKIMIPCDNLTQSKNYYCGPACVKIVLEAFNRKSKSQDEYAKQMDTNAKNGTYAQKMADALNAEQNKREYKVKTQNTSYEAFIKGLVSALSDECPIIVAINTKKLDEKERNNVWGYSVTGHYITVVGYDFRKDEQNIYVHDPNYEKPSYYKKISSKSLFEANQNHPSQTVIW